MSSCPRCSGQLELARSVLADAHGIFVPASEARRALAPSASASLRASAARGSASDLACPGCRAPLKPAPVEMPQGAPLGFHACEACGGLWFDRGELERMKAAVLAKPHRAPRSIGGYGGHTMSAGSHLWAVPEAVFAMLRGHIV